MKIKNPHKDVFKIILLMLPTFILMMFGITITISTLYYDYGENLFSIHMMAVCFYAIAFPLPLSILILIKKHKAKK